MINFVQYDKYIVYLVHFIQIKDFNLTFIQKKNRKFFK